MKRVMAGLAALAAAGACSDRAADDPSAPNWMKKRTVEAIGRAYVETAPNRARFSVTFRQKAPTAEEASEVAVEKARLATEAIRATTEGAVRVTSNLSVSPYYEQVVQRYGEFDERLVENVHPDALLGYTADVSVTVTVLDPDTADEARGAALAAGPTSAQPIYFFLEPTAEDQRAAYEAAASDARLRAKASADLAGARLGRLLLLQEGDGPCLGSISTAYGYDERDYAASPPPPAPAPVAAPKGGASFVERVQTILERTGDFELAADPDPSRVEARVCAIYALR